jgi:hypothetical protein
LSDVYFAISDSAINRAVRFLMTWQPSLFNYVAPSQYWLFTGSGTPPKLEERWLVCAPVPAAPGVAHLHFPLYTRQAPLKIPDFPLGAPYCLQITDLEIDFEPSNRIALPSEIPPLPPQRFGVRLKVAAGIGCPPDALIDALLTPQIHSAFFGHPLVTEGMAFDVLQLHCFSLELFVVGHLYTQPQPGTTPPVTDIRMGLDNVEIVDLAPAGLEEAAECYIRMMIRGYLLPKAVLTVEPIIENVLGMVLSIAPSLSPGLANNPAVEQDELRVWLDVSL